MKKNGLFFFFVIIAALFLFVGCQSPEITEGDVLSGPSLDKEFGGYGTADECVAFGDTDLLEDLSSDVLVGDYTEDSILNDIVAQILSVIGCVDFNSIKVYVIRISWGYLEGNPDADCVINWSGSVDVNKGLLLPLRAIRFEDGDYLHLPRTDEQVLDFTSYTSSHYDGVLLAVVDYNTRSASSSGEISIDLRNYNKELTFSELASVNLVEALGSLGHEVSIVSQDLELMSLAGGFLAGKWIRTSDNGGHFKGKWITGLGALSGHLKGIWGINSAGEKVLYGKYISRHGKFKGLLSGDWQPIEGANGGIFYGTIFDKSKVGIGSLAGHYRVGLPCDKRGFFHGLWSVLLTSVQEGE